MGESDDVNPSHQTAAPLTEADLLAVTIGPPQVLNSTVYLADYSPVWPATFIQLAQDIRRVLGNTACLVEHTGSTSVPGLAAKPIIDIGLTGQIRLTSLAMFPR